MASKDTHTTLITKDNPMVSELQVSWRTPVFTAQDGIGPLDSLDAAGDAVVAVAKLENEELIILGSGVMVGPGLLLTATHVLDEFSRGGHVPVFLTFLPGAARAWMPIDVMTTSRKSKIDENRNVTSDLSLVSCTLNSAAHPNFPIMLAPMQIALPLIGERLWALGFRHQGVDNSAALVTPMVSSGLVTAAFPKGRGERMASPCFEVSMDVLGGMSGGAVVNSDGHVVGIVSSSFTGGPSYITLIWEALRLRVKGPIPKLAAYGTVSLMGANALGLTKLKGHVTGTPWQDVTIRLSDQEAELFARSIPPSETEAARRVGMNDEQLEQFVETWGVDMEAAACEATIDTLGNLPLPKIREFLEESGIPEVCLEAIHGYSVEDFDGIEDLSITSTEDLGAGRYRIEFYIYIKAVIWTVQVEDNSFQANKADFEKSFFSGGSEEGNTSLSIVQRRYFKGTMVFEEDPGQFSDVSITSTAMKRLPMASPDLPA